MNARIGVLALIACSAILVRAAGACVPFPSSNGVLDTSGDPCPWIYEAYNGDGTYDTAYAWAYGGVARPYYGAFAEHLHAQTQDRVPVCCLFFDLTRNGMEADRTLDAYIWDASESDTMPGAVHWVRAGVHVSPVATWPFVNRHYLRTPDTLTVSGAGFWVGCWGNWPDQGPGWYVAADTDNPIPPETPPMTNIAPGIGYPTGWQRVDRYCGSLRTTHSLGLGAKVDGGPNPARSTSWGQIKTLYH